MTLPALKKIGDKQAAAAAKGLEFSDQATALLAKDESARGWLEKLHKAALHEDAVKLLAAALPKRECVHWALACAREATAAASAPEQKAALDAVQQWTLEPDDARRRAAGAASEQALLDNSAGCAALAAFMSGGSLAPAGLAPVPPAEHLCALSAGVAIQLAAQLEGPLQATKHLRRFFELGVKLANEPAPWEVAPPPPPPQKTAVKSKKTG
ncbi:MAG TPA: hypothetical protein VM509_08380 [Planctomycetota bacterium]|nr:hypothetical protein [Planctomycetota bacterium]